ncbi:MAG: hypothetical protein ACPGTP_09475, partial [Bacteroidia bacterium]
MEKRESRGELLKTLFAPGAMDKVIPFLKDISHIPVPDKLNDPFENNPHPLAIAAANQLQEYLATQTDFSHNFGLESTNENNSLKPIGKMFGVLVVQTQDDALGFICAFSGKLSEVNHHRYFVPPIFDSLSEDEFLNAGMRALNVINDEIKELQSAGCKAAHQLHLLKEKRK